MMNSFFDVDYAYCKSIARKMKQYLDHNGDQMDPETYLIFTQAIEHLVYAFIYSRDIDKYLIRHKDDATLKKELNTDLEYLSQADCLECHI